MPDERLTSILDEQKEHIDRYGWSVTGVFPTIDDPDTCALFLYTIGLTEHAHPEFVISGLNMHTGHVALNDMAKRVYDKAQRFAHGQRSDDLLVGYVAVLVSGPLPHEWDAMWPEVSDAGPAHDDLRPPARAMGCTPGSLHTARWSVRR